MRHDLKLVSVNCLIFAPTRTWNEGHGQALLVSTGCGGKLIASGQQSPQGQEKGAAPGPDRDLPPPAH
eukprot:2619843-Rhodomonas_salina.1